MRILIAGETYFPAFNGQAVFMTHLAEGLAGLGHQVTVITPNQNDSPRLVEKQGVQVHYLPSIPLTAIHPDAYFSPFAGIKIKNILREFQPEVVHIHDHYLVSWAAYWTARRLGIPVVGTNHFMPQNLAPFIPIPAVLKSGLHKIMWVWMMMLYNHLDLVTGPSQTAVALMKNNGLRVPAYPVSCGIDLNHFHPDGKLNRDSWRARYGLAIDRTLFGFVGRVDQEKRLDTLIQALSLLNRRDLQLAVFGKGSALRKYQELAQKLGVHEQVRFTGFVPASDLVALLNSIDIFAMPSQAELLSIASLEAMACGKPMLVANAQALPELVQEGINGMLFQTGDAVDAARCMAELADHPACWPGLGEASLRKVQPHSIEKVLLSYQDIYQKVQPPPRSIRSHAVSPAQRQRRKASKKVHLKEPAD